MLVIIIFAILSPTPNNSDKPRYSSVVIIQSYLTVSIDFINAFNLWYVFSQFNCRVLRITEFIATSLIKLLKYKTGVGRKAQTLNVTNN